MEGDSYFWLQQTNGHVHEFIRRSRYISVNIDWDFFLRFENIPWGQLRCWEYRSGELIEMDRLYGTTSGQQQAEMFRKTAGPQRCPSKGPTTTGGASARAI